MKVFGRHIRHLREARGLGQRRLAKAIGKSHVFLGKVEKGEKLPTVEVTQALARELGEDPDVLLALTGRLPDDVRELVRSHPERYVVLLGWLRTIDDGKVKDGKW